MAIRTTVTAVVDVLTPGGDYDTDLEPDIEPFIRVANLMVDRVVTCASNKGKDLTSSEARELETWLAAHAYVSSDPTYVQKWTEKAGGVFTGKFGLKLEGTRYGQMALLIDPSGCLASLQNRQVAGVFWAGKNTNAQTDYENR